MLKEARKLLCSKRTALEMKFSDIGILVRVNALDELISSPDVSSPYDPQGRQGHERLHYATWLWNGASAPGGADTYFLELYKHKPELHLDQ